MNRVYDYQCEVCGYRFEHFYHSDAPTSLPCESEVDSTLCSGTANRIESVPGEWRPSNAQRFDPIVIWRSNTDPNKFSFPGRNDEPVDAGYHAITITDMYQAQKWSKHINEVLTVQKEFDVERDRAIWADRLRQRREDRANMIRGNPQLEAWNRLMIERQDKKRQNKYDHARPETAFHIQALEMNQSNRQDWCDVDTGWKSRKG